MGAVYATFGSKVVLVEALDSILLGADPDLVRPVMAYARKAFKEVRLKAKVLKMTTSGKQIKVEMEFDGQKKEELYDRVLVSVGRVPNAEDIGLENTKVECDEKGFIKVDGHQHTADEFIYAIGDIAGGVLLAHKAFREGRVAVDAIMGDNSKAGEICHPRRGFHRPGSGMVWFDRGRSEGKGITVEIAKFPWGASGRALTLDRPDGLTKLVIDPQTERILGVGIVGHGAGELIAEGAVMVEMGATAKDVSLIVHPHPTLSETIMGAAEVFYGQATHTLSKKRAE